MKAKKLVILTMVTLAVILAAGITARLRAPQVSVTKDFLFPDLARQINDIAAITIRSNRQSVLLRQQGDGWVIGNADNYPALFNRVKQSVISLSELRILAEKTDNPDRYARLGVEGIEAEDSTSMLITLSDRSNRDVAAVIAGLPRQSSGSKPGLYVRLPESPRALLVEGSLDISDETRDWFERYLFDVSSSRVQQVNIRHPGGNEMTIYKETREQPDFKLSDSPEEVKSATKIIHNRIATSLEEMRADNVMSSEKFEFTEDSVTTTVSTFDGLIITVKCKKLDDRPYAHFTFAYDPAAAVQEPEDEGKPDITAESGAQEEATELQGRLSGWVYEIPGFKYDALTMKLEGLDQPFPAGDVAPPEIDAGE